MWTTENYLYCAITLEPVVNMDEDADAFLEWLPSAPLQSGLEIVASASIRLSDDENLRNNVSLAADSINDTVLSPGDLFSFNDTVGPRSERYGYKSAVNGRGAKVTGGGVAQVASALWLAVKHLGCVAVVEKSTYGSRYNQDYVASSNDAILTDYANGTDFSFRNTGSQPLTISTRISGDTLHCTIYRG